MEDNPSLTLEQAIQLLYNEHLETLINCDSEEKKKEFIGYIIQLIQDVTRFERQEENRKAWFRTTILVTLEALIFISILLFK